MRVQFDTKYGVQSIEVPDTPLYVEEIMNLEVLREVLAVYGMNAYREAMRSVILAKSFFIPA